MSVNLSVCLSGFLSVSVCLPFCLYLFAAVMKSIFVCEDILSCDQLLPMDPTELHREILN